MDTAFEARRVERDRRLVFCGVQLLVPQIGGARRLRDPQRRQARAARTFGGLGRNLAGPDRFDVGVAKLDHAGHAGHGRGRTLRAQRLRRDRRIDQLEESGARKRVEKLGGGRAIEPRFFEQSHDGEPTVDLLEHALGARLDLKRLVRKRRVVTGDDELVADALQLLEHSLVRHGSSGALVDHFGGGHRKRDLSAFVRCVFVEQVLAFEPAEQVVQLHFHLALETVGEGCEERCCPFRPAPCPAAFGSFA